MRRRPAGDLGSGVEPELIEDVQDVVFRRALRDHQFGSDLLVGESWATRAAISCSRLVSGSGGSAAAAARS